VPETLWSGSYENTPEVPGGAGSKRIGLSATPCPANAMKTNCAALDGTKRHGAARRMGQDPISAALRGTGRHQTARTATNFKTGEGAKAPWWVRFPSASAKR
jgi:hypothetical protein